MPSSGKKPGPAGPSEVLNALPWPLLAVERAGRVAWCNRAYAELTGRSADALREIPLASLDEPWNSPLLRETLQRLSTETGDGAAGVTECPSPNHKSLRVLVVRAECPGLGRDGYLLCIDDRRAQKALQAEVRDLNRRLESMLARRTAQVGVQAQQLQALMAELLQTETRERERLSETLHDHLQQLLVAAQFRLHVLDRPTAAERATQIGAEVRALLQQAIDLSRSLAIELSPPSAQGEGLPGGLRSLAQHFRQQYGLTVSTRFDEPPVDVPEVHKAFVLRAARELLFNVVKHAGVTEATLTLRAEPPDPANEAGGEARLVLVVADAGRGCGVLDSPGGPRSGFGIGAMRQRASALGGRLEMGEPEDGGCVVTLELPLLPDASGA